MELLSFMFLMAAFALAWNGAEERKNGNIFLGFCCLFVMAPVCAFLAIKIIL